MSYVDILVLRHLRNRPAHGYELRKRVERTVGVRLHNNSLYPALRRFEEAGAIVRTAAPSAPGRPPRHVYEITALGDEMLHDMLADLPPEQAAQEAEFMARLGQFSLLEPAERVMVLDARDLALRTRLAHYHEMHELARGDRWAELATAELIGRSTRELAWIESLRGEVSR